MFMSMEYTHMLKRLQQYRVSMNMTQEQLSSIIGIGQSKMCKMEKGDLIISYDFLRSLSDIQWNIDYLFVGQNEETTINVLGDYIKTIPKNKETKKLIYWMMESYFFYYKIENVDCDLFLLKSDLYSEEKKSLIFNLRSYLNINQTVMAEKLGVHVKKYRPMEKGKKQPDAEVLLRLYLLTGCRPGIFFEENREDFLVKNLCRKIPMSKQKEMVKFVESSQKLFD